MKDPLDDVTKPKTPQERRILTFVYIALFVVVLIAVGVPAWRGYSAFQNQMAKTSKEMIVHDLGLLAEEIWLYRDETDEKGFPRGTYQGYVLPEGLRQNANAEYTVTVQSSDNVILSAKSKATDGTVKVTVDSLGKLRDWVFEGKLGEIGRE